MIALDLWGNSMVSRANGALLLGTMALIGVTSYLPVYIQAVQGRSALFAGIPLSTMLFAWPLASTVSSRILKHLSMRSTLRMGGVLIVIGAALLLPIRATTPPWFLGVGPSIMGFGMGLLNITSMVMIQGSVEWSKRGSATSSVMFSRTLGNTFGVAALGAILNFGVVSYSSRAGAGLDAQQTQHLLGEIGNVLGGASEPSLRGALDGALRATFAGMLVFGAISAWLALLVPVRELDSLFNDNLQTPPRSAAAGQNQKVDAC
jgi:Na+/melibiose symporter-like transporter